MADSTDSDKYKNFQDLLEQNNFDYHHLAVSLDGGGFCLIDLEISPTEFLLQAEKDFEAGDSSFYLNCITNAKRAIVCQMDEILVSFGFDSLRWNIPKKIECLNKLGILTPPVLRKVSQIRNLLEHNYNKPSKEDVEVAMDIATLFVLANKGLFSIFESCLIFGLDTSEKDKDGRYQSHISLSLQRKNNIVFWQTYIRIENDFVERYEIRNTDPFFCSFVKLCAAYQLEYKIDEAIEELNALHAEYALS